MKMIKSFNDKNRTRYRLVRSNPGKVVNWIFFPGGPGIDSEYLFQLIEQIDSPGNFWLVDLLLNGTNISDILNTATTHQNWGIYFLEAIKQFEKPILVGHSFGGYFPLFFPELEKILNGFVILNSVPTLNSPEFERLILEKNLPSRSKYIDDFMKNPNSKTTKELFMSTIPYYFTENIEKGKALIDQLYFNVDTAYWWYTEGATKYSTLDWVPKQVETLIIGGSNDFLTPINIFEQDPRFHRNNIDIITIQNTGHFPWTEQPNEIKKIIHTFYGKLSA